MCGGGRWWQVVAVKGGAPLEERRLGAHIALDLFTELRKKGDRHQYVSWTDQACQSSVLGLAWVFLCPRIS